MTPDDDEVPAIRTFQMDSVGTGAVRNNVNLFRGDVNLSQRLFSMPGLTEGSALGVDVSLSYQSNVLHAATIWNREEPTSIVGLGWELPTSYLERVDSGSATPESWSYRYWMNGSPSALVPDPEMTEAALFWIEAADLQDLRADGSPTHASDARVLLSRFLEHGVALNGNARVVASGAKSSWIIEDDRAQRSFKLLPRDGGYAVLDGGQAFQMASFRFWQIRYYARYASWTVLTDSGGILTFGGNDAAGTIEWSVGWAAAGGGLLWSGPSNLLPGQMRYERAWRLASNGDVFGNKVTYVYDQVTQAVGVGGLTYTKACYLKSITDVFGRVATFSYAEKLFDATNDEKPREYADPHNPKADGSPNAFQDRYETRFLSSIDVRAATGELLFGVDLGYAVANVTASTGRLKGDTFKRYLASITLRGSDGTPAPGMKFTYCDATSSPGAIATVEYPTGAVVTYSYVLHDLDVCDRTLKIVSPDPSKAFIPGVWYGSDFAVTTWCEPTAGTLMMSVYTWIGRWQQWQLDPSDATLFQSPGGIDRDTLNVTVSDDQFVLSFAHATGSAAFVFRRSSRMPTVWQPAVLPSETTAKNVPTLTYSTADGRISFFAGNSYVVATGQTTALTTYDRMTWRWNERAWTLEHLAIANPVTVASGPTYYALIDNTNCALTLYSLGQTLQWTASSVMQLGSGPVEPKNIALDVGNCCIAICILLSGAQQFNHYQVTLLRWDASYTVMSMQMPFQDRLNGAAVSWQPTVVDDDTVGVAAHLFRFNGRDWLQNNTLYVAQPQTGQAQRYAYGKDFAAQVLVRDTTSAKANVLAFDANVSSTGWSSAPSTVTCALPVAPDPLAGNWPWAAYDDVLTIGSMAWSRGDSTDWAAVAVQSPTDLLSFVPVVPGATMYADSRTLVNQGPAFVAFSALSGSRSAANLGVGVSIRNGVMQALPTPFEGESVSVPPFRGNAGFQPGGPNAFTAFSNTAQSFELATCIILHRFAGYALTGNVTHYAVWGATVDDGFGQLSPTTYDYDKTSATCDPDGAVIKYSVASMYPGTADPAATPFGKVVTTYLNGLAQGSSSALDGLVASESTYDANANLVKSTRNVWGVMTEAAADPLMPGAAPRLLFGSYVVLLQASSTINAVPDDRTMIYVRDRQQAPFSTQPVPTVKLLRNENGTAERFATDIRYACEVYAAAKAANFLTAPALTVTTWTPDGAATITTSAAATTYRDFAPMGSPVALAPESDWKWVGGAAAEFPFGTCKHGDTVPGWNEIHCVLQRNAAGMVVTTIDAAGVTESTLYGDANLAVATFVAASIADSACAYCGFESYESGGGFVANGTSIVAGDSWSGTSSLSLAGAGASLSTTVSDTKGAAYLCGFALKTQAGYQPGANAGWTAEVTAADGTKTSQPFPFTATGGVWKYMTFPVPAGSGPRTIALRAANSGADPVFLDNVALLPLAATLVVRTFDPVPRRLTSTMDITGCTTRHFCDCFGRNTVTGGSGDATKEIVQRFPSRLGGGADAFVAASPNLDLTLHPAGLSYTESFAAGQEWVARWKPSAPADWTCVGGGLKHAAGTAGTLTWATPGANAGAPVAIYFGVAAPAALTGPFGIAFGGGYTVQYTPHAGYMLANSKGIAVESPLANPDHLVSEWLLVVGLDATLFFGDGQLIFSASLTCDLAASIGICGTPDEFTLRALTYASNPRVGIVYKDAAGRQRQLHQMCFGANERPSEAHVLEVVYDGMDRKTAVTRVAPSGFGKDAALPLLAYRPSFVYALSFLAGTASTWLMQGDVADYYRGQSDGASRRTDDEGYCYFGTRFEPSILGRIVEAGLPSKALAIHDIDTTTPLQRATTQYGFGAAPTGGSPNSLLQRKTVTTQVKRTVSVDYDAAGHPLRSTATSAAGVAALTGIAVVTYATDSTKSPPAP